MNILNYLFEYSPEYKLLNINDYPKQMPASTILILSEMKTLAV